MSSYFCLCLVLLAVRLEADNSPITTVLVPKWEQAFRYYDTDNDGLVGKNDLARVALYLIEHTPMTPEKIVELMDMPTTAWDVSFGLGGQEGRSHVTMAQWIDVFINLYQSGKLHGADVEYRTHIFHAMDENNGDKIDAAEFLLFSKSLGHGDMYNQTARFNALDMEKKGTITLSEYTNAYAKYLSDETITIDELPLFGRLCDEL